MHGSLWVPSTCTYLLVHLDFFIHMHKRHSKFQFFEHLLQISWNVVFWRSLWSYDNSGLRNPQTKTENVKLAVLLAERIFKVAPWIAAFQTTDTLEITTYQFSNTFFGKKLLLHKITQMTKFEVWCSELQYNNKFFTFT